MRVGISVLVLLLSGCGQVVGDLAELPRGADVGDAPWPLLVDTPEPPANRLMAEDGERTATRLAALRETADGRLARAQAVPPVADDLLVRGAANQGRTSDAAPTFDEAGLLARAERLRQRAVEADAMTAPVAAIRPARPVPLRPLDAPVVSLSFEERARRALARASAGG